MFKNFKIHNHILKKWISNSLISYISNICESLVYLQETLVIQLKNAIFVPAYNKNIPKIIFKYLGFKIFSSLEPIILPNYSTNSTKNTNLPIYIIMRLIKNNCC